jgi:uncharacterized small protein (DUF1192 family)
MEPITLYKINEGDSGAVSARKIYKNDENLLIALNALHDYIESYGDLIQIVTSGGTITLVQDTGMSETSVMSQKAVTMFVNREVENSCEIGPIMEGTPPMPDTADIVNLWVSRASSNADGQSLTVLYNDVQELKERINQMQETIDRLNLKVEHMSNLVD